MPLGLSAVVMATLLALGALLALSLDAHSRAAPELRAKFLVVRAALARRDMQRPCQHPECAPGEARVAQVGDWGREGSLNQSEVARAMAASGSEPDFVISTGDNFYVRPDLRLPPWPPSQCVLASPVGHAPGLCLCRRLCLRKQLSVCLRGACPWACFVASLLPHRQAGNGVRRRAYRRAA